MSFASPIDLAALALFAPIGMALLLAAIPGLRRHGWPAAWLSVATALCTLIVSILLLLRVDVDSGPWVATTTWLRESGGTVASVGLRVDGISSTMLVIVALVATAVQVFSLGYMKQEPPSAVGRYFTYHSLFVFSMNLLVLAPNLLQFFAGWELVGLTSYLLIGFYYQKPSAGHAAVKAFWVTKFADMGLLVALLVLFATSYDFGFDVVLDPPTAIIVTLLMFLAVMGKSAQFPLHVWLPNAMEGPTPVSALLHAATMVAAGVYLLVRAFPLFQQAPVTLEFMLWVGSFTALFAAVVAVVQTDIKRVLAYSTCSQLGYMVAAVGAGSAFAGYFHLTTHAFFKALLFLAAGTVIHTVHSNELSKMGGLWRRMPITAVTFIVGALALVGIPGFSGFFSKDLILEAVAEKEQIGPLAFLVAGAFLTAFYMGRVVLLAFFGEQSPKAQHAHESGPSMTLPLLGLAVGAAVVGWFGTPLSGLLGQSYEFHWGTVGGIATLLGIAGLVLSYLVYGNHQLHPDRSVVLRQLAALARSGLVDQFYARLFHGAVIPLARIVGWVDRYLVDGVMNLTAWVALRASRRLQLVQTGNVLDYVFAVIAGVVLLAVWRIWA